MKTENLLIEIGTEELPPKSLRSLAQAFCNNLQAGLEKADLPFEKIQWYASPRRLAVIIGQLNEAQADKIEEKRGPAVKAAFDDAGNATRAAIGWAKSNGIEVSQAERLTTDKGEWLLHKAQVTGQHVDVLIPTLAATALAKLPIPKPMRWGANSHEFIRPVHTLTMLYGDKLIQGEILGCESARIIRGHRFMGEAEIELNHCDDYLQDLDKKGKVIADYHRRKEIIREQVMAEAAKENGVATIDEDLLEEVTSLVEWPVTLVGSFEEKYLAVPAEALIYTMKDNQKYFSIIGDKRSSKEGQLLPKFIFVSNIVSKDPVQVVSGNEKVVRPRLADAEFFFNSDKKHTLASRLESLSSVLFQKQLGTVKEKSERIAELAEDIAAQIKADVKDAKRAGLLCKADLMSEMVMEFPDVQGVMGMYYAQNDGETEAVAQALMQQYKPRFAGDSLPESLVACCVALADKLDTLCGIFGIGQLPKGDKDPFALRRAAIGVLRIIAEKNLPLDLVDLVNASVSLYGDKLSNQQTREQVLDFILGRFRPWYTEQGVDVDVIQAVLARRPTKPADFNKRIEAVTQFKALAASSSLAAANKRVSNILNKFDGQLADNINSKLLTEADEQVLADSLNRLEKTVQPLFAAQDYATALQQLAELKEPIDHFFDSVMVMSEDEAVKINRLTLLSQLRALFLQIADISLLH